MKKIITSLSSALLILAASLSLTGVALLPGSDFGFDQNRMLARLSFTDFDGKKFMEEIEDNTKIDDTLINELAPKIVEGVDKLKKWSESI